MMWSLIRESLESILSTLEPSPGARGGQATLMWSVIAGVGTLVLAKLAKRGVKMFLVNFVSLGDICRSSPQIPLKIYWRSSPCATPMST